MENKKTFIYGLVDPLYPEVIRYVGKADNTTSRLIKHIYESKNIRVIKIDGLKN